jgi:hypothetical protein
MEKRALINFVLQNGTIDGEKLRYEAKFPFNLVLKYAPHSEWLPRQVITRTRRWVEDFLLYEANPSTLLEESGGLLRVA